MTYQQPQAGPPPQWSQAGPPPPAAKKRKKWPFVLIGIVLLIVIIAVATSGGGDKDQESASTGTSAAATAGKSADATKPAPAPKDETSASIGSPVTVTTPNTEAVFTVAGLREGQDEFGFAKGKLFVVDASVQASKGTININPLYFSARGADGQVFDYSPTNDGSLDARELPAGGKIKGAVGFDVPEGQSIAEIVLQDPIGAQQAVWKVTP